MTRRVSLSVRCAAICFPRTVLFFSLAVLLLFSATDTADGIRNGLQICGELLIPSVFPMLVFSALFIRSGAAAQLGRLLSPLSWGLFRLPPCTGSVFCIAMVGGYPAGARAIRTLREQHAITDTQAARMSLFCIAAGPGFVISAVGCGLFGNHLLGIILYVAQIAAALLLGILSRFVSREPAVVVPAVDVPRIQPFSEALSDSIGDAASATVTMCAAVLTFSALNAALHTILRGEEIRFFLTMSLEVTTAVQAARALASPIWAAFVLGWGGLSTHAQVRAIIGVPNRWFFPFRFFHGVLTALFTAILWFPLITRMPHLLPTNTTPSFAPTAVHGGFSAALLLLTAVFLLSLPLRPKKNMIDPLLCIALRYIFMV